MAWSIVTGANRGVSAASPANPYNAGALAGAILAGDLILVAIDVNAAAHQPAVTGITDSLSNSYTKLGGLQKTWGSYFEELSLWGVLSGSGGTPTLSSIGTSGPPDGIGVAAQAFRGMSATVDVTALVATNSGVTTADSGTTSGTTTAANELKIGFYGDGGYGQFVTAGTLDTTYTIAIKSDSNSDADVALEYADSGASGSTARATSTGIGTGTSWMQGVMVINLAASGPQDTPELYGRPDGLSGSRAMQQLLAS